MWKCASRTIRATLKRSVLRSCTVLSTKVSQNKDLHCLFKLAPALLERCNRFYGSYKGTCENCNNKKKEKKGPKEKKTSVLEDINYHFFDALTWTGTFILGYYILHPFERKRWFPLSDFCKHQEFLTKTEGSKALLYLIEGFGIKPYNSVLPEVPTTKSKKKSQYAESSSQNLEVDVDKYDGLQKAHQKVLGTLSNWLGTQCINSGKHKEALKYFIESAEEENAAGMFNLGICHEKGLGTSQNFERAAELYQKAASLGHPTAMYNLGVFYAQGLGGLEPDLDHARELFSTAANLGQKDAAKALGLEIQPAKETENKMGSFINKVLYENLTNISKLSSSDSHTNFGTYFNDNTQDSLKYLEEKELSSAFDSDSGILDLSPPNEVHISLL